MSDALTTGGFQGGTPRPKGTPTPLKAANDWLAVRQSEIVRDEWIDPDAGSEIFRDYAEDWLARGVRQERIRPTTEAEYWSLLDIHILLTFGDLHLRKITPFS
jgi:Phage integrase, N-terminal SAM-like domain